MYMVIMVLYYILVRNLSDTLSSVVPCVLFCVSLYMYMKYWNQLLHYYDRSPSYTLSSIHVVPYHINTCTYNHHHIHSGRIMYMYVFYLFSCYHGNNIQWHVLYTMYSAVPYMCTCTCTCTVPDFIKFTYYDGS